MKKQSLKRDRRRVPNKKLFARKARIPARVQAASELWLEMFMGFCDGLLMAYNGNDEMSGSIIGPLGIRPDHLTEKARALADSALHQFEDRWPDVKLEGTRD